MEENMNEKINVKKKGNALKYVLTFVGGAAIGAGALFGYNTFMDSKAPVTDITVNNTEVGNITEIENEKIDTATETTPTLINPLTSLEYGEYYLTIFSEGGELGWYFDSFINSSDLKSAEIRFNTNEITSYLNEHKLNNAVSNCMYATGQVSLPNSIVDIIPNGRTEFASHDFAAYFLLNDGTVYALNILNALKSSTAYTTCNTTLPAPTIIEGLTDVTSIQNVTLDPKAGGQGIAGIGTIAIKSDGTVVPLSAK